MAVVVVVHATTALVLGYQPRAVVMHTGHSHSHAARSSSSSSSSSPGRKWWHLGDTSAVKWTSTHLGAALQRKSTTGAVAADRITWIGAAVNVVLTVFKLYAGIVCRSAAMISDAVHSASDLFSDLVTLIALWSSRLPADEDHPYGHGRFETVGAMFVGTSLTFAAWGLAGNAIGALRAPTPFEDTGVGRRLALIAALVSILSKEVLYRATMVVAKRLGSAALKANAWHHRSDAMSSVVALIGIAASTVPGLHFADALAGLVVAVMLGNIGLSVTFEALAELTDTVDELDLRAVRKKVEGIEGVRDVKGCRGRLVGGSLVVDVDVVARRNDLSSSACRQLAERVRFALVDDHSILDGKGIKSATIHVVPDVKICPVVATMPSETDLASLVARSLDRHRQLQQLQPGKSPDFLHHDTIVRYDAIQPKIDIVLRPTSSARTVDDLDAIAKRVRADLDNTLGTCGRIDAIYWLSANAPALVEPSVAC
ncbi:hypothetical protein CTAYLR_004217 [Chrysophaeum taylorii]|uniref:Cation efflux protein cytoplasmic domain-containing protein n=1 Tax=Chrysophaeum taylorii TaxID=2483200 RepID=A0AAD7UEW2_9STRA|nr:hypothetical protein CTAYLR_004217 [Chrysophaeum taylorii]